MNPELRRYAWLELSTHRLIAVPLVVAAVVALVLAVSGGPSSFHPATPVAVTAFGAFVAVTVGWGTLRAYAAVIDEVRDRTWDFQRMAALGPRSMAFGKVFGAPLLSWYIGGWCLLAYVVAGTVAGVPHVLANLAGVVALALLLHCLAVALSALTARAPMAASSRRWGGVLLVLALLYLLPVLLALAWDGPGDPLRIDWWGLRFSSRGFAALSVAQFAAWAAFAAWRCMARELREAPWWWSWPAFAVFVALWWCGVRTQSWSGAGPAGGLAIVALVLCLGGYLGLALDPLTPVTRARYARLLAARSVPWHLRAPGWLLHAALALAAGLLALAVGLGTAGMPRVALRATLVPPLAVAAALMLLRDAAVLSCFTLGTRARKPLALAVFYIAVANLLLPALLMAADLQGLAQLVFPFWGVMRHPLLPAAGMAVHLGLAVGVLWVLMPRKPAGTP